MNQILRGVPNDLLTRRFDPERYQLWAFFGCTTRHYLDELRALIAGKRIDNLDLIVSTRPLYWSDSGFYPLAIVRGLCAAGPSTRSSRRCAPRRRRPSAPRRGEGR
jgi:hypothetical protein